MAADRPGAYTKLYRRWLKISAVAFSAWALPCCDDNRDEAKRRTERVDQGPFVSDVRSSEAQMNVPQDSGALIRL